MTGNYRDAEQRLVGSHLTFCPRRHHRHMLGALLLFLSHHYGGPEPPLPACAAAEMGIRMCSRSGAFLCRTGRDFAACHRRLALSAAFDSLCGHRAFVSGISARAAGHQVYRQPAGIHLSVSRAGDSRRRIAADRYRAS